MYSATIMLCFVEMYCNSSNSVKTDISTLRYDDNLYVYIPRNMHECCALWVFLPLVFRFTRRIAPVLVKQVEGYGYICHRADSRLAPSQWESSLQSNAVSYWLGADLDSALYHINPVRFHDIITTSLTRLCSYPMGWSPASKRLVTARFVTRFNLWLRHDLWPHNASICDLARFVTKSASICDQRYISCAGGNLFLCLHLWCIQNDVIW